MKHKVRELDLHGVPHAEVEMFLENFFFIGNVVQGTVITGNSKEMKNIVLDWLDQHDFHYYVSPGNMGRVEVQDNIFRKTI
jgi:DNA-nicking Smr family endonuclease